MEFVFEKNKVVGIVKLHTGKEGENARIKIIGYLENGKGFTKFSDSDAIKHFPNEGFVFEPSFFKNKSFNNIVDGDLIEFYATPLTASKGPDYNRILDFDAKKIKSVERIFELQNVSIQIYEIDLAKTKITENYTGDFYGIYEDFVIGKLRIHNGLITPVMFKEVKKWPKSNCEIIEFESNYWLLSKPTDGYALLDSMDKTQLFEWFREKLKIINKSVVKELDERTEWRKLLPEIVADSTDDVSKLNSIRLKRIERNLDNFNFLVEDIKQFTQISEKLNQSFNSAIERHKTELRSEYTEEIEKLKAQKELEKQKLEQSLSKISIDIAHKKNELASLVEEINSKKSHIEHIATNKDRILSDFSIIQEVLGNRTSTGRAAEEQIQEESFVMETVIPSQNTISITQRDKFLARLKYFVNQQNINSSMASKLIPIFASCQGVLMQKIELGLAFIEATGNSKYIIQQVEPDWLHFKDLWRNGLEAIWKSSHENPGILHFLILEDINLSSPECYMRPLLDCMNGIRKHIPFAKTAYPKNLRILATKILSDEPKIGLPLYQQTFNNWGAVGYIGDINKPAEQYNSIVEGYLDVKTFFAFMPDEFDLKIISSQIESEFDKLFDKVQ